MNGYARILCERFPIRRTAAEKEACRLWLVGELKRLGYDAAPQARESPLAAGGHVTNVVAGDPERAKLVFIAHYDTGVREWFPPLILPTHPGLYALYQALTPACAILGSFVFSFALTFALQLPAVTLPLFLLLLIAALCYLRFGPPETRNANDNASGVAALLETAAALTPRWRGEVAFAFLDGGASMAGARALRRAYPSLREKAVLNVHCVAAGGTFLILPSSRAGRWDEAMLDAILASFTPEEGRSCFLKTDGLTHYPSDNRAFRHAFALCAWDGKRVRPREAAGIDETNQRVLSRALCRLTEAYCGAK